MSSLIDPSQALTFILLIAATILVAWRLAPYLIRVFNRAPGRLDRALNPIENFIYKLSGVDPNSGMSWKRYFYSAFLLNIFQMAIAFVIFVFQDKLPLNPQGFPSLSLDLAFHTAVSFGTNTDLQHYNGEATLSIFSQMTAIQFLQFTCAATGICVAIAMVRGFKSGSKDMGNFHVDFIRSLTRIYLPLCLIAAIVLIALGCPQTLNATSIVQTIEGGTQTILVGPVASLVSVMQLGTNGGGYYGANDAYPFMNPNPASNFFEMFLMLLIPTALIFVYGHLIGHKKEAKPILIAAFVLLTMNFVIAVLPNIPIVAQGIETRFGGFNSALWTVITTASGTGSVNTVLPAMNPLTVLSGFMGMFIQASPGGTGVGLMYMIMYIVITVFLVGLMSGRTPEYLGIKVTARDVKLVMIAFLIHPLIILIPTIIAYASGAVSAVGLGTNSIGFTQILWEFTTSAANNGSDFLGAAGNTPFWNISTAIVILLGRFIPIFLLLALGGSMIGRKRSSETGLRTDSLIFAGVLIVSILIVVVLSFLPFLALGPILSFFQGLVNGFV
jgi:potassium-transporting ATPase potassium-binding subunit